MIQKLGFPQKQPGVKTNEYQHHYQFIKKYAELAGISVTVCPSSNTIFCTGTTWFSIEVDNVQVFIDYSDHEELSDYRSSIPCFKYHYHPDTHHNFKQLFPIGPMLDLPSLAAYDQFFALTKQNIYTAEGDIIINCQRPRLNARVRRQHVQKLLKSRFGDKADISFQLNDQDSFWKKHSNCLVAVCVPGARNNMLDRGQYEQLALGVCTISPVIRTTLPYGKSLIPNIHYLACRDDYSDLTKLIEWCRNNRDQCRAIGRAANNLFKDYCMPTKYWKWVEQCLQSNAQSVKFPTL
jgi:hypothetical protein